MANEIIRLNNITKQFEGQLVLDHINLQIARNEFVTLLGPSGCGKTTTLRIIGGFEQPTSGELLFEGRVINDIPAYERRINTVFQRYALFPHLNVFENVAFGLRIKKMESARVKSGVAKLLELVNLRGFEKRSVHSLSGGEQQRVAIARALVNEPEVLLLDEPLAALDLKLRKEMQIELKNIQKSLGITFVFVTHDQEEALTMSDTVVVMHDGIIQQIGAPIDIYNEPINMFVADFIGESTILSGTFIRDYEVEFAGRRWECADVGFGVGEEVDVVVRPEDVKLVNPEEGMITGEILSVIFKGVHYEMMVRSGLKDWMVHSTLRGEPGCWVGMNLIPDDIHIMKKG
ncbi:MAG: ABC transporter ATP-binding protein [Syntrophomonadaceae bacterium]|nr:ABC transporter ATP-binding protein [Syntrophomonadaceae bacterium]